MFPLFRRHPLFIFLARQSDETYRQRLKNNIKSCPFLGSPNIVLSPSYSWFNHSCAPTACASRKAVMESSIEDVLSIANLKNGDEVLVSYLSPLDLRQNK